jgi:hypothetical protein
MTVQTEGRLPRQHHGGGGGFVHRLGRGSRRPTRHEKLKNLAGDFHGANPQIGHAPGA